MRTCLEAVNNIGYHSTYGEYFDGELSNVYLIDGQALEPTEFGFTDPLTNTWRLKKYTGNVNYVVEGQVDYESGFDGQSLDAGTSWLPFYGNTSNNGYSQSKNTTLTYTAPGSGIPYTSTIRLFCKRGSGGTNNITIDGNSFSPNVGSGANTGAWNDISSYVTGGVLNTIVTSRGSGGRNSYWSAIEVDGVILTHIQQGVNGFYLPFDGNSPIGKDQSGSGNDFTPVNFGGSNTIEKATGALPILNTVNGGNVATVGVRTDAYASNLVLAVPLNGNTQDYSDQINNSRTPLTFSVNGNAAPTTAQSNFYGGSYTFDGTTDSVYATVPNSDALFLQNSNSTVECWVRIASGQTDDRYFIALASGSSSNAEGSWYIRIFQSKFEFVTVNGNTQYKTTGVSNYVPNKWTHIAFVREGNEQRLYQDGVLVVTTSHTILPNVNNSSTLFIGSSYGYNNTINAQIQDARIYDNVAKYTSNFIPAATNPDILPDTPSGVAYGSALTKITDGTVSFDGTGDYLDVSDDDDFDFDGDFTVEFYVYFDTVNSRNEIIGSGNNSVYLGANKSGWIASYYTLGGSKWHFSYQSNQSWIFEHTFAFVSGARRWYHVAFTRSGSDIKCFVDGVQQGSTQTSSATLTSSEGLVRVGGGGGSTSLLLNGSLSNVRIVKGTALYTSNFTPPTRELTNVTNTKLLCCQSATSASVATVAPGTFVNDGTNYSSNNQVTGSAGLVNADSIFNGHLRASGVPALNEGATVSLSSDNYILWTPTTGIPYSSKVEIYCYAPNGYSITNYYTFNGGTETSFVGGAANYNGNTWITVATGSGTINSIKLRLTRTSPNQSQATWYAVRVDGTILLNDQNGKSIGRYDNTSATNFNPFTTDINTVRGQETGYCTLNPLNTDNISTFSDGNLSTVCVTGSGQGATSGGNIPVDSGKWYCEMVCTAKTATNAMIGVCTIDGFDGQRQIDESQNGGSGYGYVMNGTKIPGGASYGTTWAIGDVIGVALDLDSSQNTVTFYKNGVSQGPINITNARYVFGCSNGQGSSSVTYSTNFGQKPLKYAPPEGFKTLCLANLPRPTKAAVRPDKYFKTMLWTGDGNSSGRHINIGFRPDLIWLKSRGSGNHGVYDSVRGPDKRLQPDGVASEDTVVFPGASDSGFDFGSETYYNSSSTNYVAWSWKAGGNKNTFNVDDVGYATAAEAGLNGGTITPTGASVNTESGFSIITYTGDGSTSSGVTINHGLGDTPAFIITKKRSSGTTDYGWSCWHKDIGGNYGIWLHVGNARNASMWGGHTNISSTVFSPPDLNYANENGQTYVNYLWSEVPGYSKFGTYTGNGNANGPFVECGFKPALIITKQLNGGNSWFMIDTTREPDNPAGRKWFLADTNGSEVTNNNKDFDILSNGFKPRLVTGYHNDSGVPYLYMAWAEAPTINLYGGQANAR